MLNSKIGLLLIYTKEDLGELLNIQEELKKKENEYIYDILNENYCVYPLSNLSKEADDICITLNIPKSSSVNIINFSNKRNIYSNSNNSYISNQSSTIKLNKLSLIYKTNQNQNITYLLMSEIIINHIFLLPSLENKENKDMKDMKDNESFKNNDNQIETNDIVYDNLYDNSLQTEEKPLSSPGKLIEKQKYELKRLEMQEENKKRQLQQEEQSKLNQKLELEKRKIENTKKKEEILSTLPDEPSALNEDSTLIIFRYPHSELRRERRFLKSDKIEILYLFVKSLGSDMFEENEDFELITPFPMKVYSDMQRSLFDEKLFPNAVIQIREKDS